MGRLASVGAVILLASAASAGIDLFLTRGPADTGVPGEKEPDTFSPDDKDFLSNYEPWSGNPPRSPLRQYVSDTRVYFLWAECALAPNEVFAQITVLDLRGSSVTGGMVREDGLFYRHKRRWDGSGKLQFPGMVTALTGRGLSLPIGTGELGNVYQGKSYILLGAVRLDGESFPGALQLGLGPATMFIRITDDRGNTRTFDGTPNNRYPGLTIQGKDAYAGPYEAVTLARRLGDCNCDGTVDFGDINPFVLALSDPDEYKRTYPECDIMNADCNEDGVIDFGDIWDLILLLQG